MFVDKPAVFGLTDVVSALVCSECSGGILHSWPQFMALVRLHPFFQTLTLPFRRDHNLFKMTIIVGNISIHFFVRYETNVPILASSLASIVFRPVSLALPYKSCFAH